MTRENEFERHFGNEAFRVKQGVFAPIPVFWSKEILEGVRPKVNESEKVVHPEDEPGVKISISDFEKIIPFYYQQEGLVPTLETREIRGQGAEKAIIHGTELHKADVLFSLVIQGLTGAGAGKALPTMGEEELERYQLATEGIDVGINPDEKTLFEAMRASWKRFFGAREREPKNIPLEGFSMSDPRTEEKLEKSDELYRLGISLARLWAREASQRRSPMWEYRPDAITEREVQIVMNPREFSLTIPVKFDFISRLDAYHSRVTTQVGDLKTGKMWDKDDLLGEVLRRQAQLMLLIAEKYTIDALNNKENAMKKGGAYIVYSRFENMNMLGRSRFTYKILDKRNGVVERLVVPPTRQEREDIILWLRWLTKRIDENRDTARAIVKKNGRYKLKGVPLRKTDFY